MPNGGKIPGFFTSRLPLRTYRSDRQEVLAQVAVGTEGAKVGERSRRASKSASGGRSDPFDRLPVLLLTYGIPQHPFAP